jgi:gamma-glutamyltranspeptidase/glutathione hydrolase
MSARAARAVRHAAAALAVALLAAPAPAPNDLWARGTHGAVVAAEPLAARAGLEVLQKGGNAVDAAIAVFLALAVTHPQAGNLGGGGFMLVRMADGTCTALDFRETAPAAATREMYLRADGSVDPEQSLYGATAAGVPGSAAGIAWAAEHLGTRPLRELAAPAIGLASGGFRVSHFLADDLAAKADRLGAYPSTRAVFFDGDRPLRAGALLVQKDLAATLARFAEHGADGFYRGATAEHVVAAMRTGGGYITAEDLAGYRVAVREPLRGSYRGYEVLAMPPPSSGGVALLQMLGMLASHDLRASGFGSSRTIHLLTEVMRRAYADRARWLGDPDAQPVPVAGLLSEEYLAKLRAGIDLEKVSEVAPGAPPGHPEGQDTTHFSVVDAAGNAVACTTTINSSFGSCLVVEGAGFFLNNEMDDFSAKPGTPNQFGLVGEEANAIAPGKRMLSSMTPTIFVKDGKTRFVLGSPGGGRIITTVLQVALAVIDHDMPLVEAVAAPRVHHQWKPERLEYERTILGADVRAALAGMGHRFADAPSPIGRCQAIEVRADGERIAAADPRSGGAALAY